MTEAEYEKLVRAVSNKYMTDVFPCNPVAPASFEAGIKWARENPPPEVEELVQALRYCKGKIEQLVALHIADGAWKAANSALASFKERTAGKGEG